MRVMVRPVHQAAEIIPLVQPAKFNPIAKTQWNSSCEIDVVRDEQRLTTGQLHDEALVSGTIVVVWQQPHHETRVLDPRTCIENGL